MMALVLTGAAIIGAALWLTILALPGQPWRMRERFIGDPTGTNIDLSDTTVLIPARDEAETLGVVLDALGQQGRNLSVIVANDHSADTTAEVACRHPLAPLVIDVPPLPDGWTGKLWALEQARSTATTSRLVLLDADIQLKPGTFVGLRARADTHDLTLIYYQRSPGWTLLMPIIGCLYLAMTWLSVIRYWCGRRSAWRGRIYARDKR